MKYLLFVIVLSVSLGIGIKYYITRYARGAIPSRIINPIAQVFYTPLDAYTIDKLGSRVYEGSQITFDDAIATTSAYTAYRFHFSADRKKVTGLAHVPRGTGPFPVLLQFRGYIEKDQYQSGSGTAHSATVFAEHGYLSLAPDFLGFGGSDEPAEDVFENRFQTYTTAMNLLASLASLTEADTRHVGVWGHSNGGHIALASLEIYAHATESNQLPRVVAASLWAPVTKPFPYSILYYTDESPDRGKMLRKKLADFEQMYDGDLYSLTNYIDRVSVPLVIHQGERDEAVPKRWTDDFVRALKENQKDVTYFEYPETDHNFVGSWDTVMDRDIRFFTDHLK